jgi:acyl carrier protein
MTRNELLLQMDEILGVRAGTIRGTERLEELENWDSTALISFIAMAEMNSGAGVSLNQVVNCSTVADLLRIAQADSEHLDDKLAEAN